MNLGQLASNSWPRAEIRRGLIDSGVPANCVDEITDLAIQAANQATASAFRTLDAATDNRIQVCAFGVAFSLISNFADRMIEAQSDFAETIGAPQKTVMVNQDG